MELTSLTLSSVIKFIGTKDQKKTKWFYSGEAYRKQNKNNKSPIIKQTGFEILDLTLKQKMIMRFLKLQ